MMLIQRGRHADDDDIHLLQSRYSPRSLETHSSGPTGYLGWNANNVRPAPIQRVNLAGIDIEAGNCKALLAKQQRQRQAHIAHADNADPGFARFNSLHDFCNPSASTTFITYPHIQFGLHFAMLLYQPTVRSRPSRKVHKRLVTEPLLRRLNVGERMLYIAATLRSILDLSAIACRLFSISTASFNVMRLPVATLNTLPETLSVGASEASRFPWTTFSIKVKSRLCSPSPKMVGVSPASIFSENFANTPEYSEVGS